jgi:hypothetical protein
MSKSIIQLVRMHDAYVEMGNAIKGGNFEKVAELSKKVDLNKLHYAQILSKWISYSYLDQARALSSAGGNYAKIADFLKANGAKTADEIKLSLRSRRLIPSGFFRTTVSPPEIA